MENHDNKEKGIELGEAGPYWSLKNLNGELNTSFRYRGRPLILFFFRGTWCPSCRKQMNIIKEAWSKLEPLAQVVGILSEKEESVRNFLARNPLPFPLFCDPDAKVIKAHNIYQRFGLNGFRIAYPTTVILDQNSIVRYCYVGSSQFDRPEVEEIVAELNKLALAKV